jgi:hypothetical protein
MHPFLASDSFIINILIYLFNNIYNIYSDRRKEPHGSAGLQF